MLLRPQGERGFDLGLVDLSLFAPGEQQSSAVLEAGTFKYITSVGQLSKSSVRGDSAHWVTPPTWGSQADAGPGQRLLAGPDWLYPSEPRGRAG